MRDGHTQSLWLGGSTRGMTIGETARAEQSLSATEIKRVWTGRREAVIDAVELLVAVF